MTILDRVFSQSSKRSNSRRYRATWNGEVLAESEATVVVEGNHYFPVDDVRAEHLRASDSHTVCHWKGTASYYDVVVGDKVNRDAAWYYPDPSKLAETIKGHVAFWHGVKVEPVAGESAA
jgi:uncharacterized protein (DUF427 family)